MVVRRNDDYHLMNIAAQHSVVPNGRLTTYRHVTDKRCAMGDVGSRIQQWRTENRGVLSCTHRFRPSTSRASRLVASSPPSECTMSRARVTSSALLSASMPLAM